MIDLILPPIIALYVTVLGIACGDEPVAIAVILGATLAIYYLLREDYRWQHRRYSDVIRDQPGRVAYWRLDEEEGEVAKDSSGHGHDGTYE